MKLNEVLVPLDMSRLAETAFPMARLLAVSTHATLNLLAVATDVEPGQRAPYAITWRTSPSHCAVQACKFGRPCGLAIRPRQSSRSSVSVKRTWS
jgi:hypothetical protein